MTTSAELRRVGRSPSFRRLPHPARTGSSPRDGQLWLSAAPAGAGLGTIDLVNTSNGTLETEYSPGEMEPDFDPQRLAADSHGNLYYTLDGGAELNTSGQRIGIGEIMDPGADATVTAYAVGLRANEESDPTAITDGPDGNMFFVDDGKSNGGRDELGELNTTTHAITEFSSGLAWPERPVRDHARTRWERLVHGSGNRIDWATEPHRSRTDSHYDRPDDHHEVPRRRCRRSRSCGSRPGSTRPRGARCMAGA